jgi:hypothetical protein
VLGSLEDGSNVIGPGTYTAAQLNSLDGNSDFVDSTGLNTVTVVPEPQTWASLPCGLAVLMVLWQRRCRRAPRSSGMNHIAAPI